MNNPEDSDMPTVISLTPESDPICEEQAERQGWTSDEAHPALLGVAVVVVVALVAALAALA